MKSDEAIQILKTWRITGDKAHEALDMAIDALRNSPTQIGDMISRQSAIDALDDEIIITGVDNAKAVQQYIHRVSMKLHDLPSAQPEPLSDAYMNAVWTWLLDYQIMAAELKGRYTPYEVLSWVANDWRREHG